jgi:hypothetical protein
MARRLCYFEPLTGQLRSQLGRQVRVGLDSIAAEGERFRSYFVFAPSDPVAASK